MSALREVFYLLSVLPAILYLAALVYTDQYEGWGAGYAGLALIVPIYVSFVLGSAGAVLIIYSKRRGETLVGPVIATIVAGAISVWYAGKSILLVLARPLLIGLGLY